MVVVAAGSFGKQIKCLVLQDNLWVEIGLPKPRPPVPRGRAASINSGHCSLSRCAARPAFAQGYGQRGCVETETKIA